MGGVLLALNDVLLDTLDTSRLSGQLVAVGTLLAVGLLTYLVASLLLRSREPRLLLGLLRRR
jgi:hypothetical protein